MKQPLLFTGSFLSKYLRFLMFTIAFIAMMGSALKSRAQIYYTLNDGTASATSTDGVVRVGYDGTSTTTLASSFTALPTFTAIDFPGNRAFVYEGTANALQIRVVNLSTGALASTITVPTQVVALRYDAASGFIYYLTTASGSTLATTDALRKVKPDGTGDQLVLASITASPKYLALDLTHGQVIVEDVFAATNIMKVIKIADGSSTTLISNSTPITAIEYNAADNYIYYLTSDGSFSSNGANDALVKIHPDGTGGSTIASSIAASAVLMTLDAGNKRAFIYDGAGLSPTVRAIRKIDLSSGAVTAVTNIASLANSAAIIAINVPQVAVISTTSASSVTASGATVGGNITQTDVSVTERGVVYSSTNATPVVGTDTKQANGIGTGSFSGSISGLSGSTTYYLRAYATSGAGTAYGAVVTFATQSNDATLSALSLSAGTLNPSFSAGTTTYTASVANSSSSITITPTKNNANATVKVNGTVVNSGVASGNLSLNVGDNIESILVTAQDGTTKTYNITVNRAKAAQTITFNALPGKTYGNADFAPGATVSSGLAVSYSSDNSAVATIVSGNIHIVGPGTANITAAQAGDANNLAATSVTQSLTVGKVALTVTAAAASKIYGDADPSFTYAVTTGALVGSDTFSGTLTRDAGVDVGAYAITQGTLALNTSKYTLTYLSANLTVSKRPISIQPAPASKVYGDAEPGAYPYFFRSGSLAATDGMTGSFVRQAGETPGIYALSVGTKHPVNTASGADQSSNYDLTFIPENVTISKRAITLKPQPATKVYGSADPGFPYQFVSGSVAPGEGMTGTFGRATGEDVGTYALTLGSKRPVNVSTGAATDQYYTISFISDNLNITQKTINVTANLASKVYGDADPTFNYTADALGFSDTFSGALTRAAGESAGSYAISQGTLALNTNNYTLNFTGSNFTIAKKVISVTANAASKAYGDADPAFTYTADALVNSDTFSGSLARNPGENPGSYAITQGSLTLSNNYTISYTNADLAIGKRAVTVNANSISKQYGDADPALTYTLSESLINGDTFSGSLSRQPGEASGSYAIGQGTLTAGNKYDITFNSNDLVIVKRSVTVNINPASKFYGDPDPEFTYTINYGLLLPGDHFTGTLTRVAGETGAQNYGITQGTLAIDNPNYSLLVNPSNFVITQAELIVKVDNKTKKQGEANPAFTFTYSGFKNGEGPADLISLPQANTTAGTTSPAGDYPIYAGYVASPNYSATYVDGVLTILPVSHDATLSNISLAGLSLSPAFDSATIFYEANAGDANSVTITPTVNEAHATISINGEAATSGVAKTYSLYGGTNYLQVNVTAEDGTTSNYYQVLVSKNRAVDANLTALSIGGTAVPGFDPNVATYALSVPNTTASVTIAAVLSDSRGMVSLNVNGTPVEGGAESPVNLIEGDNVIKIKVRAENPSISKTYTINIHRTEKTNNADLVSLVINPNSTLIHAASTGTNVNYTTTVDFNATSIMVIAAAKDPLAVVRINNAVVVSGTASPVALNSGTTSVVISVTARNGVTKRIYILAVSKNGSNDVATTLKTSVNSVLVAGALTGNQQAYTTSVAADVTSIALTPVTRNAGAVVKINGVTVANGTASAPISLNTGETTITTEVTAQDGITQKVYVLTVSRNGSNNALISTNKFNVSAVNTTVGQNEWVINNKTVVGSNISSITMQVTTQDPNATLYVNGMPTVSGTVSEPINLFEDRPTPVNVYILAQDGITERLYIYSIVRSDAPIATLASIKVNPTAVLTKATSVGTETAYTTSVAPDVNNITVVATTQINGATVKINGIAVASGATSAPIALNASGTTLVTIVSTALDGVTQKTYTITVSKNGSNNANVSFKMDPNSVFHGLPATLPGQSNIVTSVNPLVNSVRIMSNPEDAGAVVKIEGVIVAAGSFSAPIALSVGVTNITANVTAQDGITTKTYIIAVSRNGSNNANASLIRFGQTVATSLLSNESNVLSYKATVAQSISSVTIQPIAQDSSASLTLNGVAIANGAISSPISVPVDGQTVANITITAADGVTTKSYIYSIVRSDAPIAALASIKVNPTAILTKATSVGTETAYTTSVAPDINSITVVATTQVNGATVKINGIAIASGATSAPIALNASGTTFVTIVSTALDGVTQKTYTITVSKNGSTNANLLKLLVNNRTLSPAFSGGIIAYNLAVANEVSAIKVTPTVAESGATITVQGAAVVSGNQSNDIGLVEGDNIISVEVTSGNGTVKTYTVTVTRAAAQPMLVFRSAVPNNTGNSSAEVVVHSAISPNADGVNDVLSIDGITNYPDNKLSIINSSGNAVNEIKNYDNSVNVFDGRAKNGTLQKPGTYFYVLEYLDGKETKRKTGYIILKY